MPASNTKCVLATKTSNPRPKRQKADFHLVCESAVYNVNTSWLAGKSAYFTIACSLSSRYLILPAHTQPYISTILHFLRTNTYTGDINTPHPPAWEHQSDQPADDACGLTLELWGKAPRILTMFPEFGDGWVLHGDRALRACKLVTFHEHFETANSRAFELVGENQWRCQAELLPGPIQRELYNYLAEIRVATDKKFSSNAVFHAEMYRLALKLMLPDLQVDIVRAFRAGVKPWICTWSSSPHGFATAMDVIWQLALDSRDLGKPKIVEALESVMAAHWGWMRYHEDIMMVLSSKKLQPTA